MFPRRGVIDLPSRQINNFQQKSQQKKIELVARPVVVEDGAVRDGPAEVRGVTHEEG